MTAFIKEYIWIILFSIWGLPLGIYRSRFRKIAYQTDSSANLVNLAGATVATSGGGQAHENMQPYLALNFIIALVGLYPSR